MKIRIRLVLGFVHLALLTPYFSFVQGHAHLRKEDLKEINMRVYYQTDWKNIEFSSFAKLYSTTIAGSGFYNAFYEAVFEKYPGYESMPVNWRETKMMDS